MTIDFLNDRNPTKLGNRKMAEILVNSITSGLLGRSKRQTQLFQDVHLKFVDILIDKGSFTCTHYYYYFFSKIKKGKFLKHKY